MVESDKTEEVLWKTLPMALIISTIECPAGERETESEEKVGELMTELRIDLSHISASTQA